MKNNLAAVIVETRPLSNLKEVIENHLKYLPDYTRLYVFGSIAVEAIIDNMGIDYTFAEINRVINESEYNKLLTSTAFWNVIEEENVLIFQHDSMLLREGIEEFYEFNYVGSPWKFCKHGGNGGLSFRKKSAMLKVLKEASPYNQLVHGNEDVYFSNYLHKGYSLAPREVCEKFSCEAIFKLGTLGYHAIDKWLSPKECEQIRNQYKVQASL